MMSTKDHFESFLMADIPVLIWVNQFTEYNQIHDLSKAFGMMLGKKFHCGPRKKSCSYKIVLVVHFVDVAMIKWSTLFMGWLADSSNVVLLQYKGPESDTRRASPSREQTSVKFPSQWRFVTCFSW